MKSQIHVLHLARPTDGDPHYYERWAASGKLAIHKRFVDANKRDLIQALVVDQYQTVTHKTLENFPNIRWIVSPNTAHTHLQYDNPSIKIISLKEEYSFLESINSVPEFTLYLLTRIAKEYQGRLLRDKNISIIGMGRVGRKVATICRSIGMNVAGFDKQHSEIYLRAIIRKSDYISIHLSENPMTKNFLSSELIKIMKKDAWIINTARPSIIDENFLEFALKENLIGGAACDVMENENLLKQKKFFYTGHTAGRSIEDRIRTDEFIIKKFIKESMGLHQLPDKTP